MWKIRKMVKYKEGVGGLEGGEERGRGERGMRRKGAREKEGKREERRGGDGVAVLRIISRHLVLQNSSARKKEWMEEHSRL